MSMLNVMGTESQTVEMILAPCTTNEMFNNVSPEMKYRR